MDFEQSGSGCLLDALMAFILAFVGGFMGFSVSLPPPAADTITQVYTFTADASTEELAAVQGVLIVRLEKLLQMGQISAYQPLTIVDRQVSLSITSGMDDTNAILNTLMRTGQLELIDLSELSPDVQVEGQLISTLLSGDAQVIMTNADIAAATVVDDGFGGYAVQIDFTPEAAEIMGAFSESHIGERLAIVIDGFVLSAPIIQTHVDTTALISGNFTQAQAQMIAVQVGTAPLPVQLELVGVG